MRRKLAQAFIIFCIVLVIFNAYRFEGSKKSSENKVVSKTSPEEILKILSPFVERSRKQYNETASRVLLRVIGYRTAAKQIDPNRHSEAIAVRHALEAYPYMPCLFDRELLNKSSFEGALFLAAVLKDAESFMPNWIIQISRLAIVFTNRLFISIYESGSNDLTSQWLLILKELLDRMRVPNCIVIHGSIRRYETESQAQFMARLRNVVLEPLKRFSKHRFSKIAFVDDVFFCAQHLVRLATLNSDVACGMDFEIDRSRHCRFGWCKNPVLAFRDVWSSIDITGRHFHSQSPFLEDAFGRERLLQNQPFPVHSCWNGLVVINTGPLTEKVHFRGVPLGECPSSENVLLCEDFVRAGYLKIVVDPSVKVTHCFEAPCLLQFEKFQSLKGSWDTKAFPNHPEKIDCCIRSTKEDSNIKFKQCKALAFVSR